jgi:vancomycin resistance protein VanJ
VRCWQRFAILLIQLLGWPALVLAAAARLSSSCHRLWLLELLDTWLLYVLAPWPALGLLAARVRSRSLVLITALGSLFAMLCGWSVVGRGRHRRISAGASLRIVTANVRGENPSAKNLIDLVEREQPDVVALQEVRPHFAAEAVQGLRQRWPYFDVRPHERYAGAGLFSRWPLEAVEAFQLSEHGHVCQTARLRLYGHAIVVFNVHLETPFELHARLGFPPVGVRWRAGSVRDAQISRLVGLVCSGSKPTVIVGDFNAAAGSRPYRQLTRHLRDAFRETGRGLGHTFPQPISIHGLRMPAPLLRIDHVFFRGPLEPLAARTLPQPGSDHRVVLADLGLAGRPGDRL